MQRIALASALLLVLLAAPLKSHAACGDGVVDGVEQCDDGNVLDGDCCSSSCTFEAQGSPCNTDSPCWVAANAACDSAGGCVTGSLLPYDKCFPFSVSSKAHVTDRPASGDLHIWMRNAGIPLAGMRDPTTTLHAFCLFAMRTDGSVESVLMSRALPPEGWRQTSGGWRYRDRLPGDRAKATLPGTFAALGGRVELPDAETPDHYFDIAPGRRCIAFVLANADGYCGGASYCGDESHIRNDETVFHVVVPPRD